MTIKKAKTVKEIIEFLSKFDPNLLVVMLGEIDYHSLSLSEEKDSYDSCRVETMVVSKNPILGGYFKIYEEPKEWSETDVNKQVENCLNMELAQKSYWAEKEIEDLKIQIKKELNEEIELEKKEAASKFQALILS